MPKRLKDQLLPHEIVAERIVDVPDYPLPGVSFKDITPLLADKKAFAAALEAMAAFAAPLRPDLIVAPEARGFMFGTALASKLGCSFVPARKANKLPRPSISEEYDMEYGTSSLAMHKDAIPKGARVLIVDDLLASGGTSVACSRPVERLHGTLVGYAFVILLKGMAGAKAIDQNVPAFWCVAF